MLRPILKEVGDCFLLFLKIIYLEIVLLSELLYWEISSLGKFGLRKFEI